MVLTFNAEGHTLPHVHCRTCFLSLAITCWQTILGSFPNFLLLTAFKGLYFRSYIIAEWRFCYDATTLMGKLMDNHNFFQRILSTKML
jgi:hypothetical protein